jgi:hypothetical protein
MDRIVIHSRVGPDGVLTLSVPIGVSDADREVEVTIAPTRPDMLRPSERDEWHRFVHETAGAWQGDLARPDQGELEQRDELP